MKPSAPPSLFFLLDSSPLPVAVCSRILRIFRKWQLAGPIPSPPRCLVLQNQTCPRRSVLAPLPLIYCCFSFNILVYNPSQRQIDRMGMRGDELPVPRMVTEDSALMQSRDSHAGFDTRHRPSTRKYLQPLMVALGIFGVSTGAARYLFPRRKIQQQQQLQQVVDPGLGTTKAGFTGLDTSICATPANVVLEGADLTVYFELKAGSGAVFGVAEHESVYNGYRFWFASEENKAKFEVSQASGNHRRGGRVTHALASHHILSWQ